MITYIMAFIFYTLAMIGIMLVGFIVYKKTFANAKTGTKGSMKILDSLQIGPKKQLLVVRIKNEKFLIASGVEHTTFLAKLQDDNQSSKNSIKEVVQTPEIKAVIERELKKIPPLESQIPQVEQKPQVQETYNQGFDEIYQTEQTKRHYSELQKARLEKIQKQFKQLYEIDNAPKQEPQSPLTRKEMVRQLLRDLNETTSLKAGNGY